MIIPLKCYFLKFYIVPIISPFKMSVKKKLSSKLKILFFTNNGCNCVKREEFQSKDGDFYK